MSITKTQIKAAGTINEILYYADFLQGVCVDVAVNGVNGFVLGTMPINLAEIASLTACVAPSVYDQNLGIICWEVE